MAPLPLDKIADLCRRHGATRLELFGSATTDKFNEQSDYDFFVEFGPLSRPFISYMSLQEDLESLLGRPVDLVERVAVKNRFFLAFTAGTEITIYAA